MSLDKIYEAVLDYDDDEIFELLAALDNVGEKFSAGNLHDIRKNMVSTVLEGAGFRAGTIC